MALLKKYPIQPLNIAQCLGVVNDNFFKYLTLFLFIHLKGSAASSSILTAVGVTYVLPFLLFSSAAGVLADTFSKQRIIILLKLSEVLITALGIATFYFKSIWGSYALLFLLSMQSALFGPPKYSIIPELVNKEEISKANGIITSFTYLGIISGTFLASLLIDITDKNFALSGSCALLLSLIGFGASLLIPKTAALHSKRKISLLFIKEIYQSLKCAANAPSLLPAIFGSALFLFGGAYLQLNIIPYAREMLGYSEMAGGYLFLIVAVGIACGALIAGKISRKEPEIGMGICAALLLAGLTIGIGLAPPHPPLIFTALFLLGALGGLYIVPFDSFIQRFAPKKQRGQIIAAANFLSFCGVLIAPLLLYALSEGLRLQAAQGFICAGAFLLLLLSLLAFKLSAHLKRRR